MKELPRRNLLIVRPEGFPYGWGGATQRLVDISNGLCSHGWGVSVLCTGGAGHRHSPDIEKEFGNSVIFTPFGETYPRNLDRRGLRPMYRLWCKISGRTELLSRSGLGWAHRVVSWMQHVRDLPPFDIVWGVTTGRLGGIVAARNIGREFRRPFVVEIHDPIIIPGYEALPSNGASLVGSCLDECSHVVTVTKSLADHYAKEYPEISQKASCIYLSYDDSRPVTPRRSSDADKLVLLHAGHLYGGNARNARSLVAGMALAIGTVPAMRGNMVLQLLGAGPGVAEALTTADECGISGAVSHLGEVPHHECIKRMDAADVLVVIKFEDSRFNMQVPGKVFQYLGRAKPILGIMRDCEAATILRASGLAAITDHEPQAVASAITQFWNCRRAFSEAFRPNWEYIRQFSRSSMAERVDSVLRRCLAEENGRQVAS
jgi:hypothetical protein